MIENIEHLCTELQPDGLVDDEVAMNGEIPLSQTETSESISAEISLPSRVAITINGRRYESRRI
jgi:hypothetical protein